jgi:hypothetical protein
VVWNFISAVSLSILMFKEFLQGNKEVNNFMMLILALKILIL